MGLFLVLVGKGLKLVVGNGVVEISGWRDRI